MNAKNFYEPAEDSFLLMNTMKEVLNNNIYEKKRGGIKDEILQICEVGTGSGIILGELQRQFSKYKFFGSDINPDAIIETQKKTGKIYLSVKPLLTGFKNKEFDIIYFNTPYLPCENKENFEDLTLIDKAIYGGKHGDEVILEFLGQLYNKLKVRGEVYMLYSSLTRDIKIKKFLEENHFEYEIIKEESHFFEKLIIMKITFSNLLKKLKIKNIKNVKFLAKGKHSTVLEGRFEDKEVIIKYGLPEHITRETRFLKKLEKEKYSLKYIYSEDTFTIREKANGTLPQEFFEKANKEDTLKVIQRIINVCQRLDELGIQKFEMTNPYKHIFIGEDFSIKFIDFERSIYSDHPKNTTQVLQYFKVFNPIFEKKGFTINEEKVLEIGKKYKKEHFKINIGQIIEN